MAQISKQLRRPNFEQIEDVWVREGIQYLYERLLAEVIVKSSFSFFEYTFTDAVTDEQVRHNLGFIPKDIIVSGVNPQSGAFTYKAELSTTSTLTVSTSGACVVRLFMGNYTDGV